jgi:hypothetical protein
MVRSFLPDWASLWIAWASGTATSVDPEGVGDGADDEGWKTVSSRTSWRFKD